MVDLIPTLISATRTIQLKMADWFLLYPSSMPWTIVSDYCVGDDQKRNDVFSFVVIANHARIEDLCEALDAVAPKDIKNVRTIPEKLVHYLNSEVVFSVSFTLNRQTALLRNYAQLKSMADFIPDVRELLGVLKKNTPTGPNVDPTYFDDVQRRLNLFELGLKKKQPNERLSRQIHLVAAFCATVLFLVTKSKKPLMLRWISDRDKLIEHNDTIVYDLAYLYLFFMLASCNEVNPDEHGRRLVEMPLTWFLAPEREGKNPHDAVIRLADYLAGTLADKGPNLEFSKLKFEFLFQHVFLNSPNHWIVEVISNGNRTTMRNTQFMTG